jgi:Ankyrin repeats (3 copies)
MEHFIDKYLLHVITSGGLYVVLLVATWDRGHFQTAQLLLQHSADPNIRSYRWRTPLHATVCNGVFEVIQTLIKYDADIDSKDNIFFFF